VRKENHNKRNLRLDKKENHNKRNLKQNLAQNLKQNLKLRLRKSQLLNPNLLLKQVKYLNKNKQVEQPHQHHLYKQRHEK